MSGFAVADLPRPHWRVLFRLALLILKGGCCEEMNRLSEEATKIRGCGHSLSHSSDDAPEGEQSLRRHSRRRDTGEAKTAVPQAYTQLALPMRQWLEPVTTRNLRA